MLFDDFINCFDIICVFNLLPENPVQNIPEKVLLKFIRILICFNYFFKAIEKIELKMCKKFKIEFKISFTRS